MARRSLGLDSDLYDYLCRVSLREADVLARLRAETATLPGGGMQIAPEQGQFMALLAGLIGARRCLEVGTFTGYSALAVALALPADGRLIACDINAETTRVATRYWAEAGVADKVELRLGPALETLAALTAGGADATFDLAFIDADKENYPAYYEACLALVRPGGVIMLDNVLWGGAVADPAANDPDTAALKRLNAALTADNRVAISMLPIGDGLTIAVKHT